MRIWSLHPELLDRQALVACWRETLLAQKVLAGQTKGYRNHPQLNRFRSAGDPAAVIGEYLSGLLDEAGRRGYSFNPALIRVTRSGEPRALLTVTDGQLLHELEHLRGKSRQRSPEWCAQRLDDAVPLSHPIFRVVSGTVESFERS